MVRNIIVSQYSKGPVPAKDSCRSISGGPLYDVDSVLAVLASTDTQSLQIWTKKGLRDFRVLNLGEQDLRELLKLAVNRGRFVGSEWCAQHENGPWAACDAYSVTRREWITNARKEMDIEYYVKFSLSKSGGVLLLVSCHLTNL